VGLPVTKLGRYTLVRSLGAGGMAELFLARAEGIGGFSKLVALKRILKHKATNDKFIRMLLNEARLVATLDHPNIAQVYDIGYENDEYFFAMEYVHGQDLRHVLYAAPNHRLQLENALHVAIGVCAGLHHAHEARDQDGKPAEIVHRDVSPSNVLLSYQGAVKLVDFGVAKATSMVSETREGIIKGKYGYMSPEQCLGHPLDRRSDLFAVGILLWEMTTGRRLYKVKGELVTLQRVVYVDAPKPSRFVENYPPELERIVMRALSRDPEQRYATAEQIQIELENFAVQHRLTVSAVSMSMEMRAMFRQRVDAWQEAQQRGRSLVDHLAEISSEDALASSNGDDDGLDAVLDDLEVATPVPITISHRPPALAPPTVPTPTPVASTPLRRVGLLAVLALFALAAAGVAVWALVFRAPKKSQPAPTNVVMIAQEQEIDASVPESDSVPEITITVDADDPEPIDAAPERDAPKTKPRSTSKTVEKPKHVEKPHVEKQHVEPPPPAKITPDAAIAAPPPPPPPDAAAPAPVGPKPGTVDAKGVRAVVRSHVGEISACVDRAKMENRDLTGRVTLRIHLAPTGKVTDTAVVSSTGATPPLEGCLKNAVAGWTFPAPAGNTSAAITYPFAF